MGGEGENPKNPVLDPKNPKNRKIRRKCQKVPKNHVPSNYIGAVGLTQNPSHLRVSPHFPETHFDPPLKTRPKHDQIKLEPLENPIDFVLFQVGNQMGNLQFDHPHSTFDTVLGPDRVDCNGARRHGKATELLHWYGY